MKTCTVCGAEWSDDTKFCPNDGTTLRSAEGADLIGAVIADRYHIEKKLGEGGMGAVYLGKHVKMGRMSAIKVMAQSMASDPEAIARFNREAANAARINHHNVCAIYDFGETQDGLIYLAMEFIEGEALSDLLRREGAFPIPRATSILQQTADALQAAHDLGIVHRDLKPDNIMLAKSRGGEDVVKVVDFGIAKAMTGEEGQKVTKTGLVVGTPEYMSPEQLSGDVLDGRSDLYSLALVFFRMLTGVLPFQADSAQETMIKRLTDEPLRLNDAMPGGSFPPRLQQAMDKALQRMPADRYGSAAEFAADVAGAVSGIAAPAADTEGATQLLDAGATELLVATKVSGEPGVAPPPPAPTPTTPQPLPSPPAPPAKKKPVVAIAASVAVIAIGAGTAALMMTDGGDQPAAAEDSLTTQGPVTPGTETAPPPSDPGTRRSQPESGGDRPTGRQSAVPDPERVAAGDPGREITRPTPAVDSAGIQQALDAMFLEEMVDPANWPGIRQRAEAHYNDARMPVNLRAFAAYVVGQTYAEEVRIEQACTWFNLARRLDPGRSMYAQAIEGTCPP